MEDFTFVQTTTEDRLPFLSERFKKGQSLGYFEFTDRDQLKDKETRFEKLEDLMKQKKITITEYYLKFTEILDYQNKSIEEGIKENEADEIFENLNLEQSLKKGDEDRTEEATKHESQSNAAKEMNIQNWSDFDQCASQIKQETWLLEVSSLDMICFEKIPSSIVHFLKPETLLVLPTDIQLTLLNDLLRLEDEERTSYLLHSLIYFSDQFSITFREEAFWFWLFVRKNISTLFEPSTNIWNRFFSKMKWDRSLNTVPEIDKILHSKKAQFCEVVETFYLALNHPDFEIKRIEEACKN